MERLSTKKNITTEVGRDLEALYLLFARKAALKGSNDSSTDCENSEWKSRGFSGSSFVAYLTEQLTSPHDVNRVVIVKYRNRQKCQSRRSFDIRYLHVLGITDYSSASLFGKSPTGLQLLVQTLSREKALHQYDRTILGFGCCIDAFTIVIYDTRRLILFLYALLKLGILLKYWRRLIHTFTVVT